MKLRTVPVLLVLSLAGSVVSACGDDADAEGDAVSGDDDAEDDDSSAEDDDNASTDDDQASDDDAEDDDNAADDDEATDDDQASDDDSAADLPCGGAAEFSINMEAEGEEGAIVAVLIDASPAPPQRYENDWVVEFRDTDGAVLEDVEVSQVEPFMPEHNHDGTFAPTVEAGEEPGQFDVTKINLWMPGLWEVRFTLSSESAGDDYAVFNVCIPE